MDQMDLKQLSEAQAQYCLEHDPALPVDEMKRLISEDICDAYLLGVQEGKVVQDEQDIQDDGPEFNSST
jgi:hypothetical protein